MQSYRIRLTRSAQEEAVTFVKAESRGEAIHLAVNNPPHDLKWNIDDDFEFEGYCEVRDEDVEEVHIKK